MSDIESKVELNLNPNYYASYELFATIPGASNLKVRYRRDVGEM